MQERIIKSFPQYLSFLTLSFSMMIILSNWYAPRLIHIFGIDTDGGTLIFPITFMLSDLITEVYGYKHARRAIWCGFFFNLLFIIYGQIIVHMPAPDYATHNDMFDALTSFSVRIVIASLVSYFIAEPFNSLVMAKLKIKLQGKWLGLRFVLSTFIASGIDSLLFLTIAFYGVLSNANLVSLIITMWCLKVVIEIIMLPLSTYLAKWLKKNEQLDIFDYGTNFIPFSLNGEYSVKNNFYGNKPLSETEPRALASGGV
jgi:uncharacterized integral membrane protein (TIGR00697 family)